MVTSALCWVGLPPRSRSLRRQPRPPSAPGSRRSRTAASSVRRKSSSPKKSARKSNKNWKQRRPWPGGRAWPRWYSVCSSLLRRWAGVLAVRNAAVARKQADESRATLLLALAQNVRMTPPWWLYSPRGGHQNPRLWTQSAVDALRTGISDIRLHGPQNSVSSVAVRPNGKQIVTVDWDDIAWPLEHGRLRVPLKLKGTNPGQVHRVQSRWNEARKWSRWQFRADLEFRRLRRSTGVQGAQVWTYIGCLQPHGNKLATGSVDWTARIWNTDGSGDAIELRHGGAVNSVAFSP